MVMNYMGCHLNPILILQHENDELFDKLDWDRIKQQDLVITQSIDALVAAQSIHRWQNEIESPSHLQTEYRSL